MTCPMCNRRLGPADLAGGQCLRCGEVLDVIRAEPREDEK